MIGISTVTYDLEGNRIFRRDEKTDLLAIGRRLTRTATLDNSSTFSDQGFSESDRTIVMIQDNPDQNDIDFCTYIVKYYGEIILATFVGVFLAAVQGMNLNRNNELELTLLVKEKL